MEKSLIEILSILTLVAFIGYMVINAGAFAGTVKWASGAFNHAIGAVAGA